MQSENTFKVKSLGNLKYDRLKAILVFANVMCSFGKFSLGQSKIIIDEFLSGDFSRKFDHKLKYAIDIVFSCVEYEEFITYTEEHNFPNNLIPPIG